MDTTEADKIEAQRREIIGVTVDAMRNADEACELTDGTATAKPSSPEMLRQRVKDLGQAVADARALIVVLNGQLARARSTMADALEDWYTGSRKVTAEQNSRAFIASELAERARIAEHGGPTAAEQPQVNSSVVDRSAAYSAGGNSSDYTRKQFRGGGFRRGSYSAAMKSAKIRPASAIR